MSYRRGYVLVSGHKIVDYTFAQAIGENSSSVQGVSVAAIVDFFGGGLRPVGICGATESMAGVAGYPEVSFNDLYSAGGSGGCKLDGDGFVILKTDSSKTPTTFTARFPIDKVKGGDCKDPSDPPPAGAGNFGKLDFGGNTSTSCTYIGYFCKDYADGYYGTINDPTKGDTGNNWGNAANEASSLNLEQNVGQFWAPVFTNVAKSGGNAQFTMTYYVQLEMVNHCFSGSCKFDGATWFDFRVSRMLPYVAFGPACDR